MDQNNYGPKYLIIPWNTMLCRKVAQQCETGVLEQWKINNKPLNVYVAYYEKPNVIIQTADLMIYLTTQQVWRGKQQLTITKDRFQLLAKLLLDVKLTKTRQSLMQYLGERVSDNALSNRMSRLRKSLGNYKGIPYIDTIPGIGYRWHFKTKEIR